MIIKNQLINLNQDSSKQINTNNEIIKFGEAEADVVKVAESDYIIKKQFD